MRCKMHDHILFPMKLCAAQIRSAAGDLDHNIEKHIQLIRLAASEDADIILFPELSLTGYEPKLAEQLATTIDDARFNVFQKSSDENSITIGAGMPMKNDRGTSIGMLIFQPHKPRALYSKQHLHSDELPYFVNGNEQIILNVKDHSIAPATCYESLLPEHAESISAKANVYFTSVAKSANGIAKAFKHYPSMAKKHSMIVMMANCVGPSDDFESVGNSAVWNSEGELIDKLGENEEGILIYDASSRKAIKRVI